MEAVPPLNPSWVIGAVTTIMQSAKKAIDTTLS
jgi:hypothetical protein